MTNPKLQTLQRLRELNSRRTKGPWTTHREDDGGPFIDAPESQVCTFFGDYAAITDAEFIAALANEADWLLTCVEALAWYADEKNYVVHIEYDDKMKPIKSFNPMSEGGERARQALRGGGE